MSYIFLDTETTGLNIKKDRIIQLSYIITDDSYSIIDIKNFYLNTDEEIPMEAIMIHNIDNKKLLELSGGKQFIDYAKEILWDFQSAKVVCHNARFDVGFLKAEFLRINKVLTLDKTYCTMENYTPICKLNYNDYYGSYKWPKLEEVVKYLKIDMEDLKAEAKSVFKEVEGLHDARLDVYITYIIYKKIRQVVTEETEETIKRRLDELKDSERTLAATSGMMDKLRTLNYVISDIKEFEGRSEEMKKFWKDNLDPRGFETIEEDDIPF